MAIKKRYKKTKIKSTAERHRLSVFRSNQEIYAQIIDDAAGKTIVAASSLKLDNGQGVAGAKEVGKSIADQAKAKKITKVIFDRESYVYRGRVKALAESARENGLEF